jgi:endonuclease/exonuclease/phosphatase family metal-dependent hydrolase
MTYRLRVVGWNISEGVPPRDPGRPVAEALAADAGRFRPDVMGLQEVPFGPDGGSSLLDSLQELLGLPHRLSYPYSPAIDPDVSQSGLALLSRYPFDAESRSLLPNPGLRAATAHGEMVSWDKGVLCGRLKVDGRPLWIGAVHQFPFHRFAIGAEDPAVSEVWRGLADFLLALPEQPLILCADLNTERRDVLLDSLPGRPLRSAIKDGTSAIGMSVDDILIGPQFRLHEGQVRYGTSHHALCSVEVEYGA